MSIVTKELSDKALQRMRTARTILLCDSPFFGSLSARLVLREDTVCDTAWTDGTHLGYSPEFVLKITLKELIGVVCHEVLHCANGHPWRRGMRDGSEWNVACDLAINPLILESAMSLPEGCLVDSQFDGMASELIYSRLPKKYKDLAKQMKQSGSSGVGGVRDAPTPQAGDDTQTEVDWQVAVDQAVMIAQRAGNLPANLQRALGVMKTPRVHWPTELQEYFTLKIKEDYNFSRPNRKYLAAGLYMPSFSGEAMGELVFVIDTSGSINGDLLKSFEGECNAAIDSCRPEKVYVLYVDTQVNHVDEFEQGEFVDFKVKGGGGTDFTPAFNWIAENGIDPVCLVYFTDLEGRFPQSEPDYPTLWAAYGTTEVAPFGRTLQVN